MLVKFRNHQIMKPDDMESFTTGRISAKAAFVNPFHVFGHQPPKMYTNNPITKDQVDMVNAPMAPAVPNSSLFTNIQDRRI